MKSSNDINEALEFISLLGPDHFTIKKACEDLLIDPSQLFPKALQDFISSSTSKEMANVWLKHYEARRKARLVVIAKHLITAQIFTPTKKKNRPYSSARRLSSHSITKSTSEDTQLETIKKNIIKKISIEKNLQKIKKADEKKRKELEERLLTKSCRSDRKMPFEKEKIFKQHDERIRGILQKKYKDIEEHERNAMSSMSFRKEEVRPSSVYFNTPQKRMSKVFEDNVEEELQKIKGRLELSAQRAKKSLAMKAKSGILLCSKAKQVKIAKEAIELEIQVKNFEKACKIQKGLAESSKRKEAILVREKKRIARDLMVQTVKHAEDQARLEKELAEKAKSIENKAMQRAKVTQEIKECIEQSSKSQTLQKTIRKEMQERKLHHLQQQFGKIREKLLEKCRDSELQLKPGVDFLQLKLKLESEMRKNK